MEREEENRGLGERMRGKEVRFKKSMQQNYVRGSKPAHLQ